VALACPGLIRGGRVLYATNLGWPDEADPGRELGIDTIRIVVNDAEAAALGEAVLRAESGTPAELVYIALGTGVGSAYVQGATARDYDLGHSFVGGNAYCEGCRSMGCLNSILAAQRLPRWLDYADQLFVAQTLASALQGKALSTERLLVLGGGIIRRYPTIATMLGELLPNPIETTAAPSEAKSAAYAGLDYLQQ
jgi:predicted NBD/HSP70 family sugar kinase